MYKTLGRSGLKVSAACLGTMNFGTGGGVASCDEAEASRIIGAFLDAGHNFVDTADGYAGGDSERIVGRAIHGRRAEVVLATKAFLPQGPGPNDSGLSRAHLVRALDASLRRLDTDYIDLYQCHQWDASTPIEETMATLDGFVRSGKVRYLGCSNFSAAQLVEAQWAAQQVGGAPFVSLQSQYSLLARDVEAEILPASQRHGLGFIAWSPLGGGVLTGRYRRGARPDADTRIGRLHALPAPAARAWADSLLNERNLDLADEVAKTATALGTSPAAVALAWVRRRPEVTSVIIGPRTIGQLEENLAGFALDLPSDLNPAATRDDLLRRYFEMWNTGDHSAATELLSPDWLDHAHPEISGPSGVSSAVDRIRGAQPDLRFEIEAVLTGGALMAAVGRVGPSRLVWLARTSGGRLAELWTYQLRS